MQFAICKKLYFVDIEFMDEVDSPNIDNKVDEY
jgi:hypothetical protein